MNGLSHLIDDYDQERFETKHVLSSIIEEIS
jgi:hypothetical protein